MAKSYENYDEVTDGERFLEKLKLFGIGLGGALVGALPYVVLFCGFQIQSLILFLLSGAGALTFYAAFGKNNCESWADHLLLILDTLLAAVISNLTWLVFYVADLDEDVYAGKTVLQKLAVTLKGSSLDKGIYENMSVYTSIVISAIFGIAGLYLTFLILRISDRKEQKGESRKGSRKR